ncbi:hypothetical protein [Mesorhizobium sp.]|nr:hypothetical protein [Mesorhizobium sp.]
MTTFRVHLANGTHRYVEAPTPAAAGAAVRASTDLIVTKVKVVRQEGKAA